MSDGWYTTEVKLTIRDDLYSGVALEVVNNVESGEVKAVNYLLHLVLLDTMVEPCDVRGYCHHDDHGDEANENTA